MSTVDNFFPPCHFPLSFLLHSISLSSPSLPPPAALGLQYKALPSFFSLIAFVSFVLSFPPCFYLLYFLSLSLFFVFSLLTLFFSLLGRQCEPFSSSSPFFIALHLCPFLLLVAFTFLFHVFLFPCFELSFPLSLSLFRCCCCFSSSSPLY